MKKLLDRLPERCTLECGPSLMEDIVRVASREAGARGIRRVVEREIGTAVARRLVAEPGVVRMRMVKVGEFEMGVGA